METPMEMKKQISKSFKLIVQNFEDYYEKYNLFLDPIRIEEQFNFLLTLYGARNATLIESPNYYNGKKEETLKGKTKEVSGQTNEVSGQTNEVSIQTKEVSGQTKEVSGQTNEVSIQTNKVSIQTNEVSIQTKEVSGQTNEVSRPMKEESGQTNEVSEQTNEYEVIQDIIYHLVHTVFPNNDLEIIERMADGKIPQTLIVNKNLVTKDMVNAAMNSNEAMGEVLGYVCPGEFGGEYFIGYTINYGNNEEAKFFTEVCQYLSDKKMEIMNQRLEKFRDFGNAIGRNINVGIQEVPREEELQESFLAIPQNAQFIFDNREEIWNYFMNQDLEVTANLIYETEFLEDIEALLEKYGKIWGILIILIKNNPAQVAFPLSEDLSIDYGERMREYEGELYRYFLEG